MMLDIHYAKETIPVAPGETKGHKKNYDTDDIIALMVQSNDWDIDEVEEFVSNIPSNRAGMKMIFDFLVSTVQYRRDPKKSQWILSPSRLIHDGAKADCKTLSHFITRCLRSMGLD